MTEVTPAQTVGPFFGFALPFTAGGDMAPIGRGAITVYGTVIDGDGAPVPDALLEFWQPEPEGRPAPSGSLRRDPVHPLSHPGAVLGRDGVTFTGFGRVATDPAGRWTLHTLPPGGDSAMPYISVCVFARGLLRHLFTRIYLPEHLTAPDPLLAALPPRRRATLIAIAETDQVYRFDIRLQAGRGPQEETVFLEFP